ncbi:hypothetical protein Y032_0034g2943 [Ancylostoma ceylanicum]|uniref:Uncharacterized protein n=1 Tax=Ancylostoma ceylanicum TaxID=53326 RepID=A0A016ULR9_9BILA|nr:hypothetical protein Y032_0034g2943 [Ancylostoma ceylanicum]
MLTLGNFPDAHGRRNGYHKISGFGNIAGASHWILNYCLGTRFVQLRTNAHRRNYSYTNSQTMNLPGTTNYPSAYTGTSSWA